MLRSRCRLGEALMRTKTKQSQLSKVPFFSTQKSGYSLNVASHGSLKWTMLDLFLSIQLRFSKFANDWIWNPSVRCRKRVLYQLIQTHKARILLPSNLLALKGSLLWLFEKLLVDKKAIRLKPLNPSYTSLLLRPLCHVWSTTCVRRNVRRPILSKWSFLVPKSNCHLHELSLSSCTDRSRVQYYKTYFAITQPPSWLR